MVTHVRNSRIHGNQGLEVFSEVERGWTIANSAGNICPISAEVLKLCQTFK